MNERSASLGKVEVAEQKGRAREHAQVPGRYIQFTLMTINLDLACLSRMAPRLNALAAPKQKVHTVKIARHQSTGRLIYGNRVRAVMPHWSIAVAQSHAAEKRGKECEAGWRLLGAHGEIGRDMHKCLRNTLVAGTFGRALC